MASAIASSIRRFGSRSVWACLHRKGPPLGFDDPRVAHQARDPGTVQGGGHDEDPEIVAETTLGVEREGETEIGVERALVELVEDHRADAGQFRIVEDHAGEDPLRDHLDPRRPRDLRAEADAQTHGLAHALAEGGGHALGRAAGSQAPWFEEDDPALGAEPWRIEKRQRDASGLAGSGGATEHRRRTGFERREKARQGRIDREGSREEGVRRHRGWGGAGKR